MSIKDTYQIFKNGSTTYFFSSIFFPQKIKEKVFDLYAFVRTADNYVDVLPQNPSALKKLRTEWKTWPTVQDMPAAWVNSFLDSMELDLTVTNYSDWSSVEKYIYGSADVIGLMMAKILELTPESYDYAQALGKGMQLINFIRDIAEDKQLGRQYLYDTSSEGILFFIQKYRQIDDYARTGFHYIPKAYLVPIKTAADMYRWTADKIEQNPKIVWTQKIKPSKYRVICTALQNYFQIYVLGKY